MASILELLKRLQIRALYKGKRKYALLASLVAGSNTKTTFLRSSHSNLLAADGLVLYDWN